MELLVAALQNSVFKGRVEKNLTLLSIKTEEISLQHKPYLIAYSELMNSPTPPLIFEEQYFKYAETMQGETVKRTLELSITLDLHIIGTIFEKCEENNKLNYYNTAFICSPTRGLIGKYRKTIFNNDREKQYFSDNNKINPQIVFQLDNSLKVGILIGEDILKEEYWTLLSQQGAQLIVIPLALRKNLNKYLNTLRNYAKKFNFSVLVINKTGQETVQNEIVQYRGNSCLINPEGNIQNEVREEEWYSFTEKAVF